MPLPSDLLQAVADPRGGRIVLVIGAGCSVELPTCLPLSHECAQDAHRRLLADHILSEPCNNPSDLSEVADAVFEATGAQYELVVRLPRLRFLQATPNDGHLIAAAMLREKAIGCLLTLNFDLAMTTALAEVGNQGEVSIISGPENHSELSAINLIYLHRNAFSDPEEWIIRSSAIDEKWQESWEEVIARRVLSSPVTVFVGLGSPAGVLIETTKKIRDALADTARVFQVDPGQVEDSEFFKNLHLPEDAFIQMGWVEFMRALSDRLVEEHRNDLEKACNDLIQDEELLSEDTPGLCSRLADLGLIGVGQLRARWILDESTYAIPNPHITRWLADLLLAIGLIERISNCHAFFYHDGIVEFRLNDRIVATVIMAHGRGSFRWTLIEQKIRKTERYWKSRSPKPRSAIISGVPGGRPTHIAPPENIVAQESKESIISSISISEIFTVDELREDPGIISKILNE